MPKAARCSYATFVRGLHQLNRGRLPRVLELSWSVESDTEPKQSIVHENDPPAVCFGEGTGKGY